MCRGIPTWHRAARAASTQGPLPKDTKCLCLLLWAWKSSFSFQEYRESGKGSPCRCCFPGELEQIGYWQAVKSIWDGPIPELHRPKLMHGFPLFQGKNYFQAKYCLKLHMTFTSASPEMIGKSIASNILTKIRDLEQ